MGLEKVFEEIYQVSHFDRLEVSCDQNELCNCWYQSGENIAAKFQQDRPSSLAGQVKIGDEDKQTVRDDNTLYGI